MSVDIAQCADLLRTTLADLPKDTFEVMWDSQNYKICQIYQKHRRQVDGGTSIKRSVLLNRHGRARYRKMYDTDTPTVDQNLYEIDVPWTQIGTDYSWDIVEILRNKSSAKGFINLLESRRVERMWDLAELIEDRGWLTPTSATDNLYPFGILYYLPFLDNGSTTAGFHAKTIRYQDGTTGTTCAGIDAATESKWRSYGAIYSAVDNGLLRVLRSAVRQTRFRPAAMIPRPGKDGVGSPIELYANNDICGELEDLGDQRDDNNGPKDLAGKMLHNYDGAIFFNRMPVVYIQQLDGLTVVDGASASCSPDPIICVDWSRLQPIVQDGYWMEETVPMTDRLQHTTLTVFLDGSHQNLCTNRRATGFNIHKAIPGS